MTGYDVIGDVHGRADKLVGLLRRLGYQDTAGAWRHADRQAVFVGDLIDRGAQQWDTIRIVRAMVEARTAQIVLGNHEFNAIAYSMWNDDKSDFCRSRIGDKGRKHHDQHEEFIRQVGLDTPAAAEVIDWFRTIPLWLDLGGLRVVHACWNSADIAHLAGLVSRTGGVTDQIMMAGTTPPNPTYEAIETLLKGPEVHLRGRVYLDKGGHERRKARRRWWDLGARTLRTAALIPPDTKGVDGEPFPTLPDDPIDDGFQAYTDEVPVIVGHYWATGEPELLDERIACVDYSAGNGGPLVAYRWSGELELRVEHFCSF